MNINQKPAEVVYIRKDQLAKARISPYLCDVGPQDRDDKEPIYTAEKVREAVAGPDGWEANAGPDGWEANAGPDGWEANAGPDGWEANVQYLLDKCPYTVWQPPSAGPLDLLSTLVVTFSGMQMRLQGHPMFSAEDKREAVAAAVPEGWKLVPIEPTEEMIQAANDGDSEYTLRNFGDIQTVQQGPYDHWCAMLAAAPEVKP